MITLTPQSYEPTSSDYATLDVRNLHPVLDFDATTDESAVWTAVLPSSYAAGGLTVEIGWAGDGVTTGNVVWNAAIERIGDDQLDLDADSFAAANAVTDTTSSTDGNVVVATITFTDGADMDSVAAGEGFRIKITRDADNASDTMAADAQLCWVYIKET